MYLLVVNGVDDADDNDGLGAFQLDKVDDKALDKVEDTATESANDHSTAPTDGIDDETVDNDKDGVGDVTDGDNPAELRSGDLEIFVGLILVGNVHVVAAKVGRGVGDTDEEPVEETTDDVLAGVVAGVVDQICRTRADHDRHHKHGINDCTEKFRIHLSFLYIKIFCLCVFYI